MFTSGSRHPRDRLIVLDALTYAGNKGNLDIFKGRENVVFVNGSICDQGLVERLFTEYKIDRVVNFAAESHVDRSIAGPDDFVNTNILGTYIHLKVAKISWLDTRFVTISFIISLPMKFMGVCNQMMLLSPRVTNTHQIHHTQPPKRHRTTWFGRTTELMD